MFDFLKRKQKQAPLGTITVQGKTIKNITPLGNKHSPGVTKAGRLSFTGFLDGKKVKMYSAFSQRQVELNHAIRDVQFGGLNFPEIVASEKNLIVEEWISGKSLKELDEKSINEAAELVSFFLRSCKDAKDFQNLAVSYHDAFCYIEDYLEVTPSRAAQAIVQSSGG
ncbi:hypothetical protein [Chromohalobacter japonicus]|uniref:hypothetical protein n=1 Tax=Chromohalobacter japonicus TaxID=223900 RepID=UPI001FF310B0|nr:hypothetical protein [Chromohalobacter japonicus]MCK0752736.1 hypothetical protein [Chromohalobacter japonicus]